jgi:hypothetical protein
MTTTHQQIDERIHRLVSVCVEKIDRDPALLDLAFDSVRRQPDPRVRAEWQVLLELDWSDLKSRLLEKSERGNQLRQSAPFGGILSNEERTVAFRS